MNSRLPQDHLDALRSIPMLAEELHTINDQEPQQLTAKDAQTIHVNRFFKPAAKAETQHRASWCEYQVERPDSRW